MCPPRHGSGSVGLAGHSEENGRDPQKSGPSWKIQKLRGSSGSSVVGRGRNLGSALFSSVASSKAPSVEKHLECGLAQDRPSVDGKHSAASPGKHRPRLPHAVSGTGVLLQGPNENWNSSSGLKAQGGESRVLTPRPVTLAGLLPTPHPLAPSLMRSGLETPRWPGVRSALLDNHQPRPRI